MVMSKEVRARDLPFDRVLFVSTSQQLSVDEFLRVPLAQRVRLILAKDVEFFRGDQRINTQDALTVLREGAEGKERK